MAKWIELTLGMAALVDDRDYERLGGFEWYMTPHGYGARTVVNAGKLYLHRAILDYEADGLDVDHENGDRLDCRRSNLRACTRSENRKNHNRRWPNQSEFNGVFRRIVRPGWFVLALVPGRQVYCGDYEDEIVAAKANDMAVRHILGPSAPTNFPGTDSASPRELLIRNGQAKPKLTIYRGVMRSGGTLGPGCTRPWMSRIRVRGTEYGLGAFASELDAARMYDAAVWAFMGLEGRRRMNFPNDVPDRELVERARSLSLRIAA